MTAPPPGQRAQQLPKLWQLLFGPIAAGISFCLHWAGFPPLFLIWFLSLVGVCYLFKDEMSLELLFNWLARLIVHVFFREYDSRNTHKIPPTGPVIFICNHNNQFLDPAVVQEFSTRPISWLIAAKSYKDPTIGRFARAQRAIPVERPQDLAKTGPGKVFHSDPNDLFLITAVGDGVDFKRDFTDETVPTNATNSFTIAGETFRVASVVSPTQLKLKPSTESHPPALITQDKPISYKITPHVDQHVMFKSVWDALCDGNCVGIFPEGGSHDQTSMLPLKAGVAIMALGSAAQLLGKYEDEHGKIVEADYEPTVVTTTTGDNKTVTTNPPTKFQSVSLIACGLNYFQGHRFRGRVYAEFGDPFQVPFHLILQFRRGGAHKIQACNALLDIIRDQLKTVTVSAPSWTQLQVLWAVRRLYQPVGVKMPPKVVVVLIRRFAEGYEIVKDRQDVKDVVKEVEKYNETLKYYGLRDHQVNITQQSRLGALSKLIFRALKLLFLGVLSIPGLILNFPILLITRFISHKKANEALKASTVKVAARDVLASWKVLTALTIVPLVLCTYPLLLATFCKLYLGWSWITVWGNFVILQPFFMWSAVLLVESGVGILNSLQPLWLAVFPPQHGLDDDDHTASLTPKQRQKLLSDGVSNPHIRELRATRAKLRYKIRDLVNSLGPMIYGPGFEQLRVFPLRAQNVSPTVALNALVQSNERLPVLIPQIETASDHDHDESNDDLAALSKRNNKYKAVDEKNDSIIAAHNKKLDQLTAAIPPSSSSTHSNSSTPQSPALTSPRSTDSEDSGLSQEFIVGSDGEYHYNHESVLKELQIPEETINLLYNAPLLPQPSIQRHVSTPVSSDANGTAVPSPQQQNQVVGSTQPSPLATPQLTTTASLFQDDDTTDEDNLQEMVRVDGVAVSQAHQNVLSSEALQPISDLD